jgi:hypothetical protein
MAVGRIYEIRGGPDQLRWFWSFYFPSRPAGLRTDDRVASSRKPKPSFERAGRRG